MTQQQQTNEKENRLGDPYPDTSFSESPRIIIHAEVIIHGPSSEKPTLNGVVVMEGGKIVYVGDQSVMDELYKNDDDCAVYKVKCCMPGMWDVHSHFLGAQSKQTPHHKMWWNIVFEDRAVKVGRDVPRLSKILSSGFTSVREVGGYGKHLKKLVEEGSINGPRIYHANFPIHITGGHCDMPSDVPLQCFGSLCNIQDTDCGELFAPGSDGHIDCLKAVRQNIRSGASVIKLCCSGGVMSQNEGLPTQPQFSEEEIKIMTDEADRHDRIICAHCHSNQGILNALNNGVKCIEHFTLADDDAIRLALEKDALVVPTRWVIESLVEGTNGGEGPKPQGMSDVSWKKMLMVYKASIEAHTKAIAAGVKIATGCDIFYAEGYGTSAKELEYLVNLGMTNAKAIEAATVHGPLSLGKQAPISGQIKAGLISYLFTPAGLFELVALMFNSIKISYDADVICIDANPLEDVTLLQNMDRIKLVIKGGLLCKNIL